jgi:hypothetical protein
MMARQNSKQNKASITDSAVTKGSGPMTRHLYLTAGLQS